MYIYMYTNVVVVQDLRNLTMLYTGVIQISYM